MEKSISQLRVALVTDWMLAPGGSDRVIISLLKLFKNATVFTAVHDGTKYKGDFVITAPVKTTFLQRFPLSKKISRHYNLLAPLAFESLNLAGFDLIITLSAGPSKGIIPGINQKHLALIFTPPRTLWDQTDNYKGGVYRFITPLISSWLRMWDQTAIKRTDKVIAISKFIQDKIKKYYRVESEIIYPGISSWWFRKPLDHLSLAQSKLPDDYYLVVSRLYRYKQIDVAIKAAVKTDQNLAIVGSGPDYARLKKVAGRNRNIYFLGNVTDNELKSLYRNAKAFLFCGIEDFGLVPVEAMASGCPVFAYNEGGVAEIVDPGRSGELFSTTQELEDLLQSSAHTRYNRDQVVKRAKLFSEDQFHKEIISQIKRLYER